MAVMCRDLSRCQIVEADYQILSGRPALYVLLHDGAVASDKPEDRHVILRIDGDNVQEIAISRIENLAGGRLLHLGLLGLPGGETLYQPQTSRFIDLPRLRKPDQTELPMFRCDPSSVRLLKRDGSTDLVIDSLQANRNSFHALHIGLIGCLNVFGANSTINTRGVAPLEYCGLLDLVGRGYQAFVDRLDSRLGSTDTVDVPIYLFRTLEDALLHYEHRKHDTQNPLYTAELVWIARTLIVCAQALLTVAGFKQKEVPMY